MFSGDAAGVGGGLGGERVKHDFMVFVFPLRGRELRSDAKMLDSNKNGQLRDSRERSKHRFVETM